MDRREFIGTSLATAGAMSLAGPAARAASTGTKNSVVNTPVILECAVNGSTTKAINPLAPETPSEIATEIIKVLDAGATIVHSHSNQPNEDVEVATESYIEAYKPVKAKYPDAILYATANFAPGERPR